MHGGRPEVGRALRGRPDVGTNALELTTTNVGEILTVGARGGALVQEDRNAQLVAHTCAELAREGDAVLHRRALERDERHDVRGAHAGVLTGVRGEIDALLRLADARERRVDNDVDRRDECDDAAIVAGVGAGIEDMRARHRRDGVTDGANDLGSPAFGEVGNALDELHDIRMRGRQDDGTMG